MKEIMLVGRVLPQSIVFVVAGEEEAFFGAPPDWMTVSEYNAMKLASLLEQSDADDPGVDVDYVEPCIQ